ncbi:V-type ATP synthase subunit E [Pyrobaculum neutrophilum]|uniref:A-type ATP synthase subunit E n=1 Tax=Pyrobaculum neutrophilum (strain DSM 2338 / JCM 9278 / NBRC 100436 / V24Sta) TaxID=444157 RepID=AATE_PYRNV|nr:V-type ATP synthase subunit E [Pyrobaculum neutrophilum]B1YC21.1 RecName: Full=V-type proton ATPase subunit E; AltName: Full=V-ATPase subunit E [Pyrobaculum neutrophilum V24Sta]ACB40875.1 H+transporting two-sector ATPase E subunit [Pyrobaculum neutrophilum V24Sta]
MSLFEDLINSKIRELEDLKRNLLVNIETNIRREADAALSKFSAQLANVESEATLERERIIYNAVVEARRKIAEVYDQMLKDLVNAVYEEVDKMRGAERYVKFLTSLLETAEKYVQTKDVVIYASPKDKGVVEAVARNLGLTGIVAEKDIRGGVVVTTRDGSITVDYSLESLIANKIEELKHLLYQMTYER